jgi:hypothetical protein
MKTNLKYISGLFFSLLLILSSCSNEDYKLGDIVTPTNVKLNVEIVGQSDQNKYGDGSSTIKVTVVGDNVLTYQIDYGFANDPKRVILNNGVGMFTYTTAAVTDIYDVKITAFAYGKGAVPSIVQKDIKLKIVPPIVELLTNNDSKNWIVSTAIGYIGYGPFNLGSIRPESFNAPVASGTQIKDFPCFYNNIYKFTKLNDGTLSLQVSSPSNGVFTNIGKLFPFSGIPTTNKYNCDNYTGGTSPVTIAKATSGIPAKPNNRVNSASTEYSIVLANQDAYIGYASVAKEYEILSINSSSMYLRVQGTGSDADKAWYLKLKLP